LGFGERVAAFGGAARLDHGRKGMDEVTGCLPMGGLLSGRDCPRADRKLGLVSQCTGIDGVQPGPLT
jgi:hypothetical protein